MAEVRTNAQQISELFMKVAGKLEDMTPVFRDIADYEWESTRLRYVKQVDPVETPWPEPFTVRRDGDGGRSQQFRNPWNYVVASNYHAAPPGWHFFDKGRGDKIMRDTSTLFNSIGRSFGKDYASVGTNIEYAKKLQNGRFPFLGINDQTVENVRKVVQNYIMGDFK